MQLMSHIAHILAIEQERYINMMFGELTIPVSVI